MKIYQNFNFKNVASKSLPFMFAVAMLGTTLTSCDKDEDKEEQTVLAAPTISNLEVGIDDSHEAHIGHDLHLEADIVAEGKIDVIEVELHAEDGDDEVHVVYTEFAGLKNTTFHEHVELSDTTMAEGDYHMHFIVKDQQGKTTEVDADVHLEHGDGHDHDDHDHDH